MGFFGRRRRSHPDWPIRRLGPDRYVVELPDELVDLLVDAAEQVTAGLDDDNPLLVRLRPFASTDPDVDRSYQELLGDELVDSRRSALAMSAELRERTELDESELVRWMQGLNALRLVLGTRLDVSEDSEPELDPSDPDFGVWQLYGLLSELVDACTIVLSEDLPD